MPSEIRTTVHALSVRTMTMSLLNGSYLSAQVREEGKIWLHWYFRQQNFFINIFSDVWTKQSENVKHSQRKKKVSRIAKI